MKHILIISYDFPPYVSVGGLRPYSWYKYLKSYGIYPIVVTRQWTNHHGNSLDYISPGYSNETIQETNEFGTIIKTPYRPNLANRITLKHGPKRFAILRKIITAWYEFFQFVFLIGPKSELYFAARDYLKQNSMDAIIATGEPFVLFRYASMLSKEFGIPWIADYRDPWVQNKSRSKYKLTAYWHALFERKYLKTAKIVTTVSSFIQRQIEKNIKEKEFVIIPNGYAEEINPLLLNHNQTNKLLTFAYAGTIYNWHPWKTFLKALALFLKETHQPNISIRFYGVNIEEEMKAFITDKYPQLQKHIVFFPRMLNHDLLPELARANVFLLFNDYSILGTKIYDYLVVKRKIVLCFADDKDAVVLKQKNYPIEEIDSEEMQLQAGVIKKTNSGVIVKDSQHLLQVLHDLFNEFNKSKLISCNSKETKQFSRKFQTQRLAALINRILD